MLVGFFKTLLLTFLTRPNPQPLAFIPAMYSHLLPFTAIYGHLRDSNMAGGKSTPGRSKVKPW